MGGLVVLWAVLWGLDDVGDVNFIVGVCVLMVDGHSFDTCGRILKWVPVGFLSGCF